MGTRGAFGVAVNGEEKIGYNQFDSYPEYGGINNLKWLRDEVVAKGLEDKWRKLAADALLVDDTEDPHPDDIVKLARFTDTKVSSQSTDDWYCLTRETHGDIGKMIECGFIYDASDFVTDTLFCEWAYMIDFDKRTFEVYSGRRDNTGSGRWSHMGGVPLIAIYSFDNLPTDENFLIDTAGPECSDCTYRRPASEGSTIDGVFTCEYCIDKKVAI